MSKKVWVSDPYERKGVANFVKRKWSEMEQSGEKNRRRSAWSKDIDQGERRERLGYWFYTWLLNFMFMASALGIVMSVVLFAFRSPTFYASLGVLILTIFLMKTKKSAFKIKVQVMIPIPDVASPAVKPINQNLRKMRREIRTAERMMKENEREIKEFMEVKK